MIASQLVTCLNNVLNNHNPETTKLRLRLPNGTAPQLRSNDIACYPLGKTIRFTGTDDGFTITVAEVITLLKEYPTYHIHILFKNTVYVFYESSIQLRDKDGTMEVLLVADNYGM